jgi:hypothetical protein
MHTFTDVVDITNFAELKRRAIEVYVRSAQGF